MRGSDAVVDVDAGVGDWGFVRVFSSQEGPSSEASDSG